MADRVVITGVRRGPDPITALELSQMMGRAGRRPSVVPAEVVVVASESDRSLAERLLAEEFRVSSSLGEASALAFALLGELNAERPIAPLSELERWYQRSLACRQGAVAAVTPAVQLLVELGMVTIDEPDFVKLAPLGGVANLWYFRPETVHDWRVNLGALFARDGEMDDQALAAALADVRGYAVGSSPVWRRGWIDWEENETEAPPLNYAMPGAYMTWLAALGGPARATPSSLSLLRADAGRICRALEAIGRVCGWRRANFLSDLEVRLQCRVQAELVPLCRLPGIGKGLATTLYEMGIGTIEELRERREELLDSEDPRVARCAQNLL